MVDARVVSRQLGVSSSDASAEQTQYCDELVTGVELRWMTFRAASWYVTCNCIDAGRLTNDVYRA